MDCWNIYWSGGIVYKSAGGLVWTDGTLAGVLNSSIKVMEDWFELLEHLLEWWNHL